MFVHRGHQLSAAPEEGREGGGSGVTRFRPAPSRFCRAPMSSGASGHVIGRRASFDDRRDMLAPGVERRALLISPIVALIDAHHPGAAAGNMVENGLRHLKPNTKLL